MAKLPRKPPARIRRNKRTDKNSCTYCGSGYHSSVECWKKPKKPIRKTAYKIPFQSAKAERRYEGTKKAWLAANKSAVNQYVCWLRIHPNCPIQLTAKSMNYEHIYPRSKFSDLKYEPLNIKPACVWCNGLKLSNTPQQLAIMFPNIAVLIETEEFMRLNAQLVKLSPKLAKYLELTK